MPVSKQSSEAWWKIKKAMELLNESEKIFARYNMDMASDSELRSELGDVKEAIKNLVEVDFIFIFLGLQR